MPPKLRSNDGKNVVIRPLAYCKEKDIEAYALQKQFPIIPCDLCGSQPNLQRQNIKQMLQLWDKTNPGRVESIFTALTSVKPSQLADRDLFDFASLQVDRSQTDGDAATAGELFPKEAAGAKSLGSVVGQPHADRINADRTSKDEVEERVLNWVPSVPASVDSLI